MGPTGEICVNTLKKDWTPDLGIRHILLVRKTVDAILDKRQVSNIFKKWWMTLVSQVIKCLLVVPNPESALNEEAGKLLLEGMNFNQNRSYLIRIFLFRIWRIQQTCQDFHRDPRGTRSQGWGLKKAERQFHGAECIRGQGQEGEDGEVSKRQKAHAEETLGWISC